MKDSVDIKKVGPDSYAISRKLVEVVSKEDLKKRIADIEADIEAYTDTMDNLVENKEEILKSNAEKIDKDIEQYKNAISRLNDNILALKDALVLGKGHANGFIKGDTRKGAE